MNSFLERLSIVNSRLELLARMEADLHTQFLELAELRERVREAQVAADSQKATRDQGLAPLVVTA